MKKTKIAGKALTVFAFILLAVCIVDYWFVDGQRRAAEKYISAMASGNLADYNSVTADSTYTDKDIFTADHRTFLTGYGELTSLEENDVISSKAHIKEHHMNDLFNWDVTVDADFFSGTKSASFDGTVLSMRFEKGRWLIYDDNLPR